MTLLRSPPPGVGTRAVLLCLALASSAQAQSQFSRPRIATVLYTPGGPTEDGYEYAAIDVRYFFGECTGTVDLLHRLLPESLRVQRYCWYGGKRYDLPATVRPEQQSSVVFEGQVEGAGGMRHFRVNTFDSDAESRCGDGESLGEFSEYWKPGATPEERLQRLESMNVATASAGFQPVPLKSGDVERYLNDLRRQEERKEQQAKAEAERTAQQEAQAQAEKERHQREADSRSESSASADSGTPSAAGTARADGNATETRPNTVSGVLREQEREYARGETPDAATQAQRQADLERIGEQNRREFRERKEKELADSFRRQREDQESYRQTREEVGAVAASLAPGVQAIGDAMNEANYQVGTWVEVELSTRMVTNFATAGFGAGVSFRGGGFFFGEFSLATWDGTAFTKKFTNHNDDLALVIYDDKRVHTWAFEASMGVAAPINRTWCIRALQGGFYVGGGSTPEADDLLPATATVEFGAFIGSGVTYRLPKLPLAFAFDARLQTSTYPGGYPSVTAPHELYLAHAVTDEIQGAFTVGVVWRSDSAKRENAQ